MARRALGAAQLAVVQALRSVAGELAFPAVLGLSGGPDSLALAAAAAHLRLPVTAVVVDHGLQAGSDEVAQQAAATARTLGLDARVVRVEVSGRDGGLEAAARTARLDALADGAQGVLLGHTQDDQAETVLLGLARGSGAGSLQGMAAVASWPGPTGTVRLVRPLLGLRRALVHRALDEWGLTPWQDPMNDDPRFRRVRVRGELLPLLDDVLGGGTVPALARTAAMLRDDAELLDALAEQAMPSCRAGDGLDVASLSGQPGALRSRVVRRWLLERGVPEPGHGHVHAVLALVDDWHGQLGVDLPGGVRVSRRDGVLVTAQASAARGSGDPSAPRES